MILENLIKCLPEEPISVREIACGLHWTGVSSKYTGLASSLWSESLPEVPKPKIESLMVLTAQQLAHLALSDNYLESDIGIAAINSMQDPEPKNAVEMNAYDLLLDEGRGKNIAMIGHFPFFERIKAVTKNLWILEKNPRPGDIPASESAEYIPRADIVAITGSTFVNHSIDQVLSLCSPNALVIVMGPSTPLSPILFNYGISVLSGTCVVDEVGVLDALRKGGGYSDLPGVKKITIRK